MVDFCNRVCRCRRSVNIAPRAGRNSVRNRGERHAPVGSCAGLRPERHICRNGVKPCLEHSAARIFVFLERAGICISRRAGKLVNLVHIVSEFRQRDYILQKLCIACASAAPPAFMNIFVNFLNDFLVERNAVLGKAACNLHCDFFIACG